MRKWIEDINDEINVQKINFLSQNLIIYSIWWSNQRESILSTSKKFLHIHGYLPRYKGSTTNFYSIIEKNIFGQLRFFK